MTTLGKQLADHRGIGPGFDLVRLVLAASVLFVHRSLLTGDGEARTGEAFIPHLPWGNWVFDTLPVPLFFALSGFLVAASAERLPLRQFLLNRLLRVLPALWVAVAVAALVLGPLLTSLPLPAYVEAPAFAGYLLNAVGLVHQSLPGVFVDNPEPGIVNGSLWTVPHEVSCYLLLAALTAAGLMRRRGLLLAATLGLCGISIVVALCGRFGIALPHAAMLDYAFVTRGAARLVPVFLTGVLAYQYRDAIPYRGEWAVAAFAAYVGLCAFGTPAWIADPVFTLVTAPLLTYAVVAAGLCPALRVRFLAKGDISYGIYLYGYPLQQAIVHLLPGLKSVPIFMALSGSAAVCLACLSWIVVEKPVLRLRRRFSVAARVHTQPAAPVSVAAAWGRAPDVASMRDRSASAGSAPSLDPSMNHSSAAVLME